MERLNTITSRLADGRFRLVVVSALALAAIGLICQDAYAQRRGGASWGLSIGGGDGPGFYIGENRGGPGPHGPGLGYGYGQHSGVNWGVQVPLGDHGGIGVGNGPNYYGPYHPGPYHPGPGPYPYHHPYPYAYRAYYYQPYSYFYARDYGYVDTTPAAVASNDDEEAEQEPVLPTPGQLARLSDTQLRELIGYAAADYIAELDALSTGDGWKKYFKLADLKAHADSKPTGPISEETRAMINAVAAKMATAQQKSEYETITNSNPYKVLLMALQEYGQPAVVRTGHHLTAIAKFLGQNLDAVSTGEGWKKYLQLDYLVKVGESGSALDKKSIEKLEKALAAFDTVRTTPDYKVVAEVKGFDAAQAALQRFIGAANGGVKKVVAPPTEAPAAPVAPAVPESPKPDLDATKTGSAAF